MVNFKRVKYKILKGALSSELASFCYHYFLNKRKVVRLFFDTRWISPFSKEWGRWDDGQVPNTYSHYGDLVMETLLTMLKPEMEKETGYKLTETYSYARLYKKGDILRRHKDRAACEVSTTLNLGGDPWAIYLEPSGKEGLTGIKINLSPGDMLIYAGGKVEHWRERFEGETCCQVFLHYNDSKSFTVKKNKYDQRPFLGLPDWFRNFKLKNDSR